MPVDDSEVAAYELKIGEQVTEKLITAGYNPRFGARPLKRAMQKLLENPLSMVLLSNKYLPGDSIEVKWSEDKVSFI